MRPDRGRARSLAAIDSTVIDLAPAATGRPADVISTDVLVVGGGPAGAGRGYWLARHGHDVTVVERKTFPRDKTCGDGLTPRAVHQLDEMGLADQARARSTATTGCAPPGWAASWSCSGRAHPIYPNYGYVVRRRDLDTMVADNAVAAGATPAAGPRSACTRSSTAASSAAPRPTASTGRRVGADRDPRRVHVVVADGANSRFGAPSARRRLRDWPYGTAIRTYWESPRHAEPWIESALDVKDRNGNPMPGYGWIFPVGDGTVNIGVGLLSTFRDFKGVNTTHLLDALRPPDRRPLGDRPGHARVQGQPAGASRWAARVGPKAGPTYLVVGDAAGSVNPFNGEGIDYAYETARMAAEVRARGARRRRRRRPAAIPDGCSTTRTASTSRSPGCSPGSSGGRR